MVGFLHLHILQKEVLWLHFLKQPEVMKEKAAFVTIQAFLHQIGIAEILAGASTYHQIYLGQIICLHLGNITYLDGIRIVLLCHLNGNGLYLTCKILVHLYSSPFKCNPATTYTIK